MSSSIIRTKEALPVSVDALLAEKHELLQQIKGVRERIREIDSQARLIIRLQLSPYLTPRQQEVLGLVQEGRCNKEIAGKLNIAERTAKFHLTALLAIFQVKSREEL